MITENTDHLWIWLSHCTWFLQLSKVGNSLLITSYVMCGNSISKNGKHILHDKERKSDL